MSPDDGFAAACALHQRRLREGWRAVGRKIGFTNRSIWPIYGVYAPIWGTVYDRTLTHSSDGSASVSLQGLEQPRIEPEICFKLRAAPRSARKEELLSCLEWVAHSVEIVQCRQLGWKGITAANATAENGLHGRLIVGAPVPVGELAQLDAALPGVEVRLFMGETMVDRGIGENVLGSPLLALGYLVDLLARKPDARALEPGEIITTGTLTDAHPVAPGELWRTELSGLPLKALALRFS